MKRGAALLFALALAFGVVLAVFWDAHEPSADAAPAREVVNVAQDTHAAGAVASANTPAAELHAPPAHEPAPHASSAARVDTDERAPNVERAPAMPLTRADVRGRVIRADDELGQGGVRLEFVAGATVLAETTSGPRGDFEVQFESRGGASVRLADGWRLAGSDAERGGMFDATGAARELSADELCGESVLVLHAVPPDTAAETAFVVRGTLLSERGAWTDETLPRDGAVLVDLVAQADPGHSTRAEITQGVDASGAPTLTFELPVSGRGPWELTLSALDGFRWSPTNVRISGATKPLEFLRYDREKTLPLAFEVTDARTGTRIESFAVRRLQTNVSRDAGVFLHTGPIELGTFPIQGPFRWSLTAAGYAPAFGDETSFVEDGERRVAHVELERGWGTQLLALARDPVARPLAGAEVFVEDRFAGRTAHDGTIVLRGDTRPTKLEVRYAGFAAANDPLAGHAGRSAEQRGQVTLAFLEPVK